MGTLRGAERDYRIDATSANALARIEDATGLALDEALVQALGPCPDMGLILKIFGAMIVDPLDPSPEAVAAIVDDIGGPKVLTGAVFGWAEVVLPMVLRELAEVVTYGR